MAFESSARRALDRVTVSPAAGPLFFLGARAVQATTWTHTSTGPGAAAHKTASSRAKTSGRKPTWHEGIAARSQNHIKHESGEGKGQGARGKGQGGRRAGGRGGWGKYVHGCGRCTGQGHGSSSRCLASAEVKGISWVPGLRWLLALHACVKGSGGGGGVWRNGKCVRVCGYVCVWGVCVCVCVAEGALVRSQPHSL